MDGELSCGVIDLRRPESERLPLILASPHSGSDYPAEFVAASRLDPLALRRSEDSFVDKLFGAAPSLGAPMFSDALPEFVNAGSPRVRMGLGTIARIVANGEEIYSGKLYFADARRRIESLYHPYHQALSRLVEETEALFGGYLLIDCHSMPSAAGVVCGPNGADIVLGDCHGAACAPTILEAARHFLAERGFAVAVNAPYAGGFTTDHYSDPRRRRHALQIEINRALYMDERNFRRNARFAQLAAEMSDLIRRLSLAAQECLADTSGRISGTPP